MARIESEFSTYLEIRQTVGYFVRRLEAAEQSDEQVFEKLSLFVFLAFLIEGLIDEVSKHRTVEGYRDQPGWEDRLKPLVKDLCAQRPPVLDWNKPPMTTVRDLFEIRIGLSHPKRVRSDRKAECDEARGHKVTAFPNFIRLIGDLDAFEVVKDIQDLERIVLNHYKLRLDDFNHKTALHFGE